MGGKTISTSETRVEALKLQSSAYGVTIPMGWGVFRGSGNLGWYGGFKAVPHTETQGSKGGGGRVSSTSYTYTADVLMILCHGRITNIPTVWRGKLMYAGGVSGANVNTVSENYTPPGSGAMTYTVTNSAAFSAFVGVTYQEVRHHGGDAEYDETVTVTCSLGSDYTVSAGVVTVVNEALRGVVLSIEYQYTSGGSFTSALDNIGLSFIPGDIGQSQWSGLSTYGVQSIGYSGLACVAGQAYDLGSGAQIENHSFEIVGPMAYHLGSSLPDVDVSVMLRDALTNARAGARFPGLYLDNWDDWSDFTVASNLLVSPLIKEQMRAADVVATAAKLTNTGPVWSAGRLKMVPYADTSVTGNGRTFTPNTTPVYDLDDDSWATDGPGIAFEAEIKSPAERYNHVRIEYLDRSAQYNPSIAEAKDTADIDANGLRSMDIVQAHWICTTEAARMVAQILLQRSLYVNATYKAPLPWHYSLLEPMDLVTLTDSGLVMDKVPARLITIEENESGDLNCEFEDYPAGVASAAIYPSMQSDGYAADYNVDPGNVDTPVLFEAPADLVTTGIEVYAAVRGVSSNWGGCQVWVSLDGSNYKQAGVVNFGARYGALSASMTNTATTAAVNGLGSQQLLSGTSTEAQTLQTLCYIGGTNQEYLAYQTASLTGAGAYTLGSLVRPAYNTVAAAHSSGAPFVRVDDKIAKSGALNTLMVGKTIYFKFCSYNIFGGGQQTLDEVSAYTYTVTGSMAALVPNGTGKGVRLQYSGLTFQIDGSGTATPSSITLTASRLGSLAGSAVFTVTAGTATLTGTGDVRTLAGSNLTTDSATIRATITDAVSSYYDEVTIVKVANGASPAVLTASPESLTLQADSDGNVATFSVASSVASVAVAGVDQSSSWTITKADTNVVSTIAGSGAKTITVTGFDPTKVNANYKYTVLQLHAENNANDSSKYAHQPYPGLSNVTYTTSTPAFGSYCFRFAGGDLNASCLRYGPDPALRILGAFSVRCRLRIRAKMFYSGSYFGGYFCGSENARFTLDPNGSGLSALGWGWAKSTGDGVTTGSTVSLGGNTKSACLLNLNQWYALEVTRDASNVIRLFVDGVLADSTTSSGTDYLGAVPTYFDVGNAFAGGYISGWPIDVDEVQFINGAPGNTSAYTVPNYAYGDQAYVSPGYVDVTAVNGGVTLTKRITVTTVPAGVSAVSSTLSQGAWSANATADGVVSSYSGSGTTFLPAVAGVADSTGWSIQATTSNAGITVSISGLVLTITGFGSTLDTGTVTITGTKAGFAPQVLTYQLSKNKAAASVLSFSVTPCLIAGQLNGYVPSSSLSSSQVAAVVKAGTATETGSWTFSIAATSSGITATNSGANITITGMTTATDSGYIDVTASRSGYTSLTQRLPITKTKLLAITGPIFWDTIAFGASVTIQTNGLLLAEAIFARWYAPTTTSIGSSYWVRITNVSGTSPTGITIGSWVSMASAINLGVGTAYDFVGQMDIADSSSGTNIVGGGLISMIRNY